jgi:2,3-bisphosphoglycerate-independent phosphoglycerate mutase
MIAHTGNLQAGIAAMEATDSCLARLESAVREANGLLVVSADHGNIEEMLNEATGEVDTEHSTNPVPFFIVSQEHAHLPLRTDGILGDIAPTILALLNRPQPHEMTGQSLLIV